MDKSVKEFPLISIKNSLFILKPSNIELKHIIDELSENNVNNSINKILNEFQNKILYNGKFWELEYAGNPYKFIDNIKSFYLSNLEEKFNSINQLIAFFSSNLKNIELMSLHKLGFVIIDHILYIIKKIIDINKLGKNKILLDEPTSFVGVEILGKNKLGDLVFLDSKNQFKPIFSISSSNLQCSENDDNIDFIIRINNRLENATKILKILSEKNFESIENKILYIESCLQKIEKNPSMITIKKILILEEAYDLAYDTKYYDIIYKELLNNYSLFIKELLSLGEISRFSQFINKITTKYANTVMEPIVDIVIEFVDSIRDINTGIDFLIKIFNLGSNTQKALIKETIAQKCHTLHSYLISKLDFSSISNLQLKISECLSLSEQLNVLFDLAHLILSSKKNISLDNYINLLELYLEIANSYNNKLPVDLELKFYGIYSEIKDELYNIYILKIKSLIDSIINDLQLDFEQMDQIILKVHSNYTDYSEFDRVLARYFYNTLEYIKNSPNMIYDTFIKIGNYGIAICKGIYRKKIESLIKREVIFQSFYSEGVKNLKLKNYDVALENLRSAAIIKPKYFRIWFFIGQVYFNLKLHDKAKNALKLAYKYAEFGDYFGLYQLSLVLENLNEYKYSLNIIYRLLKSNRNDHEVYDLLTKISWKLKNYALMFFSIHLTIKSLIQNYQQNLLLSTDLDTYWQYSFGMINEFISSQIYANNRTKRPTKGIKKIMVNTLHKIGSELIIVEEFDKIFDVYKILKKFKCKIKGNLSNYLFKKFENLGVSFHKRNQFISALKYYNELIYLNPSHVNSYIKIGICYIHLEKYRDALIIFKFANKLAPNNIQILNNLAILYYNKGLYEKCYSILQKVLEIDPTYFIVYYNLSLVSIKKGDFKNAIIVYLKYLQLQYNENKNVDFIIDLLQKCVLQKQFDEELFNQILEFFTFIDDYDGVYDKNKLFNTLINSNIDLKFKVQLKKLKAL